MLPGKQKCVYLLLTYWVQADLETVQSSLLGVCLKAPHARYCILTDTTMVKAIEVSANLHNEVSKGEGFLSIPVVRHH